MIDPIVIEAVHSHVLLETTHSSVTHVEDQVIAQKHLSVLHLTRSVTSATSLDTLAQCAAEVRTYLVRSLVLKVQELDR